MRELITLMYLPAQSGKTRKMTDLMNLWDCVVISGGNQENHINIIFTSNNKLLAKQTKKRVDKATECDAASDISELSDEDSETDNFNGIVKDAYESKRTIAWIAGGEYKTEKQLDQAIRAGDIDNVICCTNKNRLDRAMALIRLLERNRSRLGNRTINIWIDEADACMKQWTKRLNTIKSFGDLINKFVLISATNSPVIRYLHRSEEEFNLRVYPQTHAECYVRFTDCILEHAYSELRQTPIQHICAVLDKVHPQPGSRWFCPGAVAKKSHNEIADELLRLGFNVLILNGDRKQILFADSSVLPVNVMETVSDDVELSDSIRQLYYEYQLYDAPFATTGNMCVNRGITFASKNNHQEFMFTHGIISDIGSDEDIYQIVARCLGNFREYDTFVNPQLFMTEIVASKIRQQENVAINLARRYYNGNDTATISPEDLNVVLNEHPTLVPPRARKVKTQERVPVILPFGPEQDYLYSLTGEERISKSKVFASLTAMISGNPEYERLMRLIHHDNTETYSTAPNTDDSYRRKILDVVSAAERGNSYTVDIDKKQKESGKNVCSVFVDKRHHRLCVVVWSTDSELY